jgi:[acyl-carrier-protein] S-malonyltransferase
MSSIFVFPGQGSQSVGMGKELFDTNDIARRVFEEVDDALNQKLSDIIFNGPMEELTLTANVQPAIMAVSIAMFHASGLALTPYVAGHSLGEYTALCAAGALSLADTARLLRLRGDAMQAAVPVGVGMVSVIMGLDIAQIHSICKSAERRAQSEGIPGVCEIANDNSPGQVVISGTKEIVEIAMQMSRDAGAKRAMALPLSAPVHCSLQAPTAEIMRGALADIKMNAPNAALISNMTAAPMTDINEIKDALVYQITHGVRWRESVLAMPGLGITETVECGPGAVLTGLTPRIVDTMTSRKLEI